MDHNFIEIWGSHLEIVASGVNASSSISLIEAPIPAAADHKIAIHLIKGCICPSSSHVSEVLEFTGQAFTGEHARFPKRPNQSCERGAAGQREHQQANAELALAKLPSDSADKSFANSSAMAHLVAGTTRDKKAWGARLTEV